MTVSVVAKDASLTSLQVTITALMVSGKQMTLAVFRQLPRLHALNDDGSLTPLHWWGRVLYSIKDEGDHWAVGERDGLLYRCYIPDRASRPYHDYEIKSQRDAAEYGDWTKRPQARADIVQGMIDDGMKVA